MSDRDTTVLVIGGGPGGYVAAIRTAQHGLATMLVDDGAAGADVGGTCLNVGCIPSKAIIHAADRYAAVTAADELSALGIRTGAAQLDLAATMAWKDAVVARLGSGVAHLLDGAGATRVRGRATMLDGKHVRVEPADGERPFVVRAEHVVLATGSRPVELPALPFGDAVLSSTDALALRELPHRLAVVGAGYIGLELGTAFRKLGAEVTVVEMTERILPQYDRALTAPVAKRLAQLGVRVLLGARAGAHDSERGTLAVTTADGEQHLPADRVLVTVGRAPATSGWGLEALDLDMDGPFVRVDDRCRTSMRGVYAIGDLTGEPMLAHRASMQADVVADVIAGRRRSCDGVVIPEVCFTDPEVVSVGATPGEAGDLRGDLSSDGGHHGGHGELVTATFPYAASGRALTLDRTDGFVRLVARAADRLVIGAQAVGPGVSELSGELVTLVELGATLDDVALIVHAHPTLSEAIPEAAMRALGRGLHGR